MVRDVVHLNAQATRRLWREWEGAADSNESTVSVQHWSSVRDRSDVVKSDHITPTPYEARRYTCKPNEYHQWTEWKMGWNYALGKGLPYRDHVQGTRVPSYSEGYAGPGHIPNWVRVSARTRARSRLAESDVNVGNLLGEMPETLKMIASNAITVLQAYRALRRGRFRDIPRILGVTRVKDLPKSTAGAWFAYKFGWHPFLTDTYNLHAAVMEQLNRPVFSKAHAVQTTADNEAVFAWQKTDEKVLSGCEVGLSYKVQNERLAQLNALGLVNPVSLAWELIPLSFVVDWFLPVGSFLQSMSAPLGLTFRTGYETDFIYNDAVYTMPPIQGYTNGNPCTVEVKCFGMRRTVLTTWPQPNLYIRTGLDNNQVLTLLGLLAQRAT